MTDRPDDVLGLDPATLTYEQARDALGTVVTRLESGSVALAESLALWEHGEALAKRCNEWLDDAERRLAAASGDSPSSASGGDAPVSDVPF